MKETKIEKRVAWIKNNETELIAARDKTSSHAECKGKCGNGATCHAQSSGGFGFWVHAFRAAGIECNDKPYWSGSNPTPSTSINRGMANYIRDNAPTEIR